MHAAVKRCTVAVAIVCGLMAAVVGGGWWVGNTELGRSLIERSTDRLTSGQVVLKGLGGSFPLRPTLRRLELRDSRGVWLSADDIAVDWSPLALLERRIQVERLRVARVHMERTPVSESTGGSPHVPHIEVGQIIAPRVELGGPLVGTPATLAVMGRLRLRSLMDADVDVSAHRVNGDGDYALQLRFDERQMNANLAVHEPAGGPLANLVSLPGLGPLAATLTVRGPHSGERVDLGLTAGPLRAGAHGTVDMTNESAVLDYALSSPAMTPRPGLAWGKVELTGSWRGTLTAPTAQGRLSIETLALPGSAQISRLTADLSGRSGSLAVRAAAEGLRIPGPQPMILADGRLTADGIWHLNQAARPFEITVSHPLFTLRGRAETSTAKGGTQHANAVLNVRDVAKFAAIVGQDVHGAALLNAEMAATDGDLGLKSDLALDFAGGTASWIPLAGPRVTAKFDGAISASTVTVRDLRLTANSAAFALTGSGRRVVNSRTDEHKPPGAPAVVAQFIRDLKLRWQMNVPDLSLLSHDLAGDVKLAGQVSGSPLALTGEAEAASHLSVRGSSSGEVHATIHAHGLTTEPSGTLQAGGMVDGSPLDIDAAVDRDDRKTFRLQVRRAEWKSTHVAGDITTDAGLTQSHGQLDGHIGQLADFNRLLGVKLGGSVDGSVTLAVEGDHTRGQVQLDGKNLAVGAYTGDLHMGAAGVANAMALTLTGRLPALFGSDAELAASGVLDGGSRELHLSAAAMDYRGEQFKLLSPAIVSFARGVEVDDLRLGAQRGILEIQGQAVTGLDLHASLTGVDAGLVNVFAPELLASGKLTAQASLQGSYSHPSGEVQFDAADVRFADDAATGLPALEIHAHAQLAGTSAALKGSLTAGRESQLTLSGNAPLDPSGEYDVKIDGHLDVGLTNPFLEARGLHAAGQLAVNATVTGDYASPQVGGGIKLAKGSLRDYAHGVNLSDAAAEITGNDAGLEVKSFTAKAISGTLGMTGNFGILRPGMPIDLQITAKNAQPIASSIVTANLDADLHVTGTVRERIDVAGALKVNRATIGIPDSLPPDVAVLDVRRRGKHAAASAGKQLVIGMHVAIRSSQILVQGRGLDAELGGEVDLSGTTADLAANGSFDLQRGSFTIAGTKLDFKEGRVGFDGAGLRKTIDPTLDFTAETTVADASTTLRITGFADAPRFEFSSSPTLPQDEIMARLLFGESAAQLSALQVAQIGASLATLSGVGGGLNPLLKLQKSLGLDRLTVGSNTTTTATGATESSGAAIAAGRYISKRVYVEGRQTTAGNSQVQVDVDLSKHLKLQTRLGNGTATTQGTTPENDPGSSVGLIYQFEY